MLLVLLAAVSLAYLLRPIVEEDFFWHLKTGDWIVDNRRLPATDPFSSTGGAVDTAASRFTLTSYWASQVLYHFAFAAGGLAGIVSLRILLAASLLALMWHRCRGDLTVRAALLLVFSVLFLERYSLERPQAFSFLAFGTLLLLLDRITADAGDRPAPSSPHRPYRDPVLVGLLMLAWANCHGGFVLGQAVIVAYVLLEGAKFMHPSLRPAGRRAYRSLLVACGAGLGASLANPNTFHALGMVLPKAGAEGQRTLIAEYLSMTAAFKMHHNPTILVVWALMLLVAVAVVTRLREADITETFLLLGSAYYAFRHVRYIAFFLIVAMPILGRLMSRHAFSRWLRLPLAAVAVAVAVGFAWNERGGLQRLRSGEWVDRAEYPVEAADFILSRGLKGNMYNFYNWGGYLLWRLSPDRKVFVDGRNINPGAHWQSLVINLGFEQGGYAWKALLDRHRIDYVLIPRTYEGLRVPLSERLAKDPGWVLLFDKSNAVIFQRRTALAVGGQA